jgi:hypothetical protein
LLLSANAPTQKKKAAFTSVAFAVCINAQIAIQNYSSDSIQAQLKCIIAKSIASSTGLMVISDYQIAH